MKRVLLATMFLCATMGNVMAQQPKNIIVRTGTVVDLQALKTIYAKNAEIGDNVDFKVISDIKQNGTVVIPSGTIAKGVITEAKKSSLAGTKGRLCIDFKYIIMADGTQIPLSGNTRVVGKNRTPLAVITAVFVWPCIFIPGTKAVLTEGHKATATILANTEVPVE